MSKTLIKNAKAIVTMNDNQDVLYNQNILIEDQKITYIGKDDSFEVDEVIDASDMYVYPGLVNTHHHFYQTFTRNLPEGQEFELFEWLKYYYNIWSNLTDETIYYSSLTAMGELIKYGVTTAFDHHYVFRSDIECKFIDEQFRAADIAGIRMVSSRGSMSLGVDDGGLPPMSVVQNDAQILADSKRLIETYHDKNKYAMKQVVLAPCSLFSITKDLLIESAKLAREHGVRLHTHLGENEDEINYCLDHYGKRSIGYMEECNWVGNDVWYAHGIHFNDEELKLLAKTKTGVCYCPTANQKVSMGIARISEMRKMGIPVGLGVDGSTSNDSSNMLAEIKNAYLLQRLKYSDESVSPSEMLRIATRGGAEILGRNDIGYLAEGMAADMFMIDTRRIQYVGTNKDPMALPSIIGIYHPVDYNIINGKVVVKDGEILTYDEKEVTVKAEKVYEEFLSKSKRK